MKAIRLFLFTLLASPCFGQALPQAFDWVLTRRTDDNSATFIRFRPTSATQWVMPVINPNDREPATLAFSSGEFTCDVSGGGTNGTTVPGEIRMSDAFWNTLDTDYQAMIPAGTTGQYYRGDKSWVTFPTIPTNTNQLTNGAGFATTTDVSTAQAAAASDATTKANAAQSAAATDATTKANAAQATAIQRANHTGTQTASTISDFTASARAALSMTTTGTSGAATYNSSTGVINVPQYAPAARSFANTARSLNAAFQISTTRDCLVSYSIDTSASATLLGGQTGTVFLEYADNSSFTTNVVEVGRSVNGNTVSLAIAITVTQNVTSTLSGVIPANKYVRIRTEQTAGTPTFNYRSSQEVQL